MDNEGKEHPSMEEAVANRRGIDPSPDQTDYRGRLLLKTIDLEVELRQVPTRWNRVRALLQEMDEIMTEMDDES